MCERERERGQVGVQLAWLEAKNFRDYTCKDPRFLFVGPFGL